MQLCSIAGLNPLDLFVPGETDQFANQIGRTRSVNLYEIDKSCKRLVKMKIFYANKPGERRDPSENQESKITGS